MFYDVWLIVDNQDSSRKKTTCYLKLEHSLLQALSNRHIFSAKYHMQRENKNHVQNLSPEATANMPTKMPYSWKHCLFKQNNFLRGEQLAVIGWGWAKYCDLSVVSRSIIFRSRRLKQIIELRDTDKSRYCDDRVQKSFYHSITKLVFQGISSGSKAICHFHARVIARRRKAWFHLRMSRIV